ncbi:MAG: hypothetical protein WKF89_05720, partial [Chitinophagaceae bacterium]
LKGRCLKWKCSFLHAGTSCERLAPGIASRQHTFLPASASLAQVFHRRKGGKYNFVNLLVFKQWPMNDLCLAGLPGLMRAQVVQRAILCI